MDIDPPLKDTIAIMCAALLLQEKINVHQIAEWRGKESWPDFSNVINTTLFPGEPNTVQLSTFTEARNRIMQSPALTYREAILFRLNVDYAYEIHNQARRAVAAADLEKHLFQLPLKL